MEADRTFDRPTLSLAMIVKNESKHLDQCLRLARPWVDEIVVIDTGSTDGTQEIARRYADVFEEIPWPGSFAEARNYSFDRAHGDYILVLDGDEWIESEDQWRLLVVTTWTLGAACIQLRIRNLLPAGQLIQADTLLQERVFKNDPALRYEGRVHNQIMGAVARYCADTGLQVYNLPVEVTHVGYMLSREESTAKYTCRLELLEAEIREAATPLDRAYYEFQLVSVLMTIGERRRAVDLVNRIDHALLNEINRFYCHMIGAQVNRDAGDYGLALAHADRMLAVNAEEPMAYFITGYLLLESGRVQDGLRFIKEAYNKNEDGKLSARFTIARGPYMSYVAQVCEGAGRWERARFFLEQWLAAEPESADARRRLARAEAMLAAHAA